MDEGLSKAVRKVFVELYHQGLIYQGNYIINWCHRCHTALADLEVEHEELDGNLYHIRYPYDGADGGIVVATTRPETMLGDTAVAVHPEDERYAGLDADHVILPLNGEKNTHHPRRLCGHQLRHRRAQGHPRPTTPTTLKSVAAHGLPNVKVIGDDGLIDRRGRPIRRFGPV